MRVTEWETGFQLLRQERREQAAYFFARHPPALYQRIGEGLDRRPVSAQQSFGVFANDLEKGKDPLAVTDDLHGQPHRLVEILAPFVPRPAAR